MPLENRQKLNYMIYVYIHCSDSIRKKNKKGYWLLRGEEQGALVGKGYREDPWPAAN